MTYEEIYQAGYEDGVHDGYYSSSIEDGIEEKHFGKSFQEQPTSDDCVSRTQALKELKESAEHHANDSREEVLLRRDRDIIRALPPVTPTHGTCKDCENWDKECHYCFMLDCYTGKDFCCKGFEKRGGSDGSN